MNHREPTSAPPRGVGQALPCLVFLLLPTLAADRAWSRPNLGAHRLAEAPQAYLPAIGAPSLRFLAPTPPPDLVGRPPAGAPPQPAVEAAAQPDVVLPAVAPVTASSAPTPTADTAVAAASESTTPARAPAPILVDELRPRVRAEDFLPYFQIPSEHPGDPTVIVPVPRGSNTATPLPPSSATYTQSPK